MAKFKDLTASLVRPTDDDFLLIDIDNGAGGYDTKKIQFNEFGKYAGLWTKKTILSADVLTLNSTPIELIPSLGVGTAIIPEMVVLKSSFNTSVYATNTQIEFYFDGSTQKPFLEPSGLAFGSDVFYRITPTYNPIREELVENSPFMVTVGIGNPTTGDSDIEIYTKYSLLVL